MIHGVPGAIPTRPASPVVPPPAAHAQPSVSVRKCPDRIPLADQIRRAVYEDPRSPLNVVHGIEDLTPDLCECWQQEGGRGIGGIRLQVAEDGRVMWVSLKGQFRGTALGACVAQVVQTAVFPAQPAQQVAEFSFALP